MLRWELLVPEARNAGRLLPPGVVVNDVTLEADEVVIAAHVRGRGAKCPGCGHLSRQVHSRYERHLSDLPAHGRRVRVRLTVRRLRCSHGGCARKIFAERPEIGITRPYARRTTRLQERVALSRRRAWWPSSAGHGPAASCSRRAEDTLLRSVRAGVDGGESPKLPAPRVIGIDEGAWKKGHRYGTIICDLERHRVIDILPDREGGTIEAWLAKRPSIKIVSRDRGGGYGSSVARALPTARQVADRWHLFECDGDRGRRCGRASPEACQPSVRRRSQEVPWRHPQSSDEEPDIARASHRGRAGPVRGVASRRQEINAAVQALAAEGLAIKAIVRRTGCSRQVVRRIVRDEREDVLPIRQSSLEPWLPRLDAEWAAGCRNGAELWRRLRAAGFHGPPAGRDGVDNPSATRRESARRPTR